MNDSLLRNLANLTLKCSHPRRIQSQTLFSSLRSSVNTKSTAQMNAARGFASSVQIQVRNVIATGPDGTQYDIPLKPLGNYTTGRHAPKLAPRFKNARIAKLRTTEGKIENIRHSPWRMNLICQFVAGKTVPDALLQLQFCEKSKAPLVTTLLQRTMNSANQKYGLLPSQLEVAECFATHGSHLKRVKVMGRGRSGKKLRRFSHIRMVLREIDFPLKIITCTSINQRNKWVKHMEVALEDQKAKMAEMEEIESLEKELEDSRKKLKE